MASDEPPENETNGAAEGKAGEILFRPGIGTLKRRRDLSANDPAHARSIT